MRGHVNGLSLLAGHGALWRSTVAPSKSARGRERRGKGVGKWLWRFGGGLLWQMGALAAAVVVIARGQSGPDADGLLKIQVRRANMTTVSAADMLCQLRKATEAIAAATGFAPNMYRPAGGLSNDACAPKRANRDWLKSFGTLSHSIGSTTLTLTLTWQAALTCVKSQIKPRSVVLLHDTYSSAVDLVYQLLPVLGANGYHKVTVSHVVGDRAPASNYGWPGNGPPANAIVEPRAERIPTLLDTASPKPAPYLPITDIPNQNSGGPPA